MKQFKTLVALVLALALTMTLVGSAMAASITITRDSSYSTDGTDDGTGRAYSYYKVFSASYDTNSSTGGGSTDGAPDAVTASAANASYTATSTVAAKLGSWDAATKKWTKETGNEWFDLTPIAGSDKYSVAWVGDETAARVQAAAAWLIEKGAYEAGPTALTFANGEWTSGNIDAGYYLIKGDTGNNLVAATTDITINEKNVYPQLDKTQADEDNTTQSDDTRDVAVGDVLTYNVKVTVPATAKVGDVIEVWDKAATGLTYNNDLAANPNVATDVTLQNGDTWRKQIVITATNLDTLKGKDVVFSFTMTVNTDALTNVKENTSGIKYGNGTDWNYESKPDKVEYKTYFAGIEKVDGTDSTTKLEGVKFTLKEGTVEFTVSKPTGKDYYVPDANGSSVVVTAADGTIKIRGLDKDKTYTLTETENPNAGYNMLAEPVTLTLNDDTYTVTDQNGTTTTSSSYDGATVDTWQDVENNKGAVLPSTGGIGTTIFYIAGAVLVLGAAAIVIARRKAEQH